MQKELDIKLIDGYFSVEDANILLMELLRFKINFHNGRLFRDYEREGKDISNSKQRLAQLNRSLTELRRYMADAQKEGRTLEIHCSILVSQQENFAARIPG